MPRVYDSASNPIDLCIRHYPSEAVAERKFGDTAKTGEGPDGRGNCYGYEAEHPPYEGEDYRCHTCGKLLTEQDN